MTKEQEKAIERIMRDYDTDAKVVAYKYANMKAEAKGKTGLAYEVERWYNTKMEHLTDKAMRSLENVME